MNLEATEPPPFRKNINDTYSDMIRFEAQLEYIKEWLGKAFGGECWEVSMNDRGILTAHLLAGDAPHTCAIQATGPDPEALWADAQIKLRERYELLRRTY